MRSRDVTTPLSGQFVVNTLGLAMINMHTKLEVSMFTHYKDMKGNEKCRNLSPAMWPIQYSSYDLQQNFNRNYVSILYRFWVTASYYNLPYLHMAPHWGWLFEIRPDLWHQILQSLAIMQHCFRDSMFSCFDSIAMCDKQTRHMMTTYTVLA